MSGKIPGAYLLIARHGQVAFSQGFGVQGPGQTTPTSEETIFRIFSMTKPIVTVTAMTLVEEGKLSVDDPVSKYLPEYANLTVMQPDGSTKPAQNPMLVRHLMAHTSGLIYGFIQPTSPLGKHVRGGGRGRSDQDCARAGEDLRRPAARRRAGHGLELLTLHRRARRCR